MKEILSLWLPIAASRVMILLEFVVVTAFLTRLENPTLTLAVLGGVVWPIAFLLESPVWMLLPTSTSLCKSWERYHTLLRFSVVLSLVLLSILLLVVCTPLYNIVTLSWLAATPEVAEAAWIGLLCALPWGWLTADRRLHQGILIRAGDSRALAIGTLVRLASLSIYLLIGCLLFPDYPIAVGTCCSSLCLLSELLYVRRRFSRMKAFPEEKGIGPLSYRDILRYYVPLALTSAVGIFRRPVGTASMFRMPMPVASVAAAPIALSVADIFYALSYSYLEVVLARGEQKELRPLLRRFAVILAFTNSAGVLIFALSPLSTIWFSTVLGVPEHLQPLAQAGLLLLVPTPALVAVQAIYQGEIMIAGRTRRVTEAMLLNVVSLIVLLLAAITWQGTVGIFAVLAATTLSTAIQTCWLRRHTPKEPEKPEERPAARDKRQENL